MTTIRVGPLSRPRGGSVQWQGSDPAAVLLRDEFFGAQAAGLTASLSATLAAATVASTATTADLDVPPIGATAAAGYSSSTTATTSAVTTQASTAFLVFAQWETTSTPPTITDNKGNTYGTPIRTVAPGAGSIPNYLGAWFLPSAAGGTSHTFTATGAANTFPSIWMVEVQGAATQANVGAGSTASPYNSGNLVTTAPARLVGFAGAENTTTVTQTVNSAGFVKLDEITDGSAAWTGVTAHRQASAGTYSFEVGVTSSQDGGAILVAVEEAAGSGITGSLTSTLGAATLSSTGGTRIAGTASQTLAAATLASTATLRIAGTLSATLGDVTLTAASGLRIAGALNQTLGAATVTSTGSTRIAGALTQALGDTTLASTATVVSAGTIAGQLAVTLDAATLQSAATVTGGEPAGPEPRPGGGGYHALPRTNKKTREAALRAYEAAEQAASTPDIPAPPEPAKAAPRKAGRAEHQKDIASGIAATQAALAANTAMADALARVSDGVSAMVANRERDEADELAALLLILAEA